MDWASLSRRIEEIDGFFGCRTTSLQDMLDLQDAVLLRSELQLAGTLQLRRLSRFGLMATPPKRPPFPLPAPAVLWANRAVPRSSHRASDALLA